MRRAIELNRSDSLEKYFGFNLINTATTKNHKSLQIKPLNLALSKKENETNSIFFFAFPRTIENTFLLYPALQDK